MERGVSSFERSKFFECGHRISAPRSSAERRASAALAEDAVSTRDEIRSESGCLHQVAREAVGAGPSVKHPSPAGHLPRLCVLDIGEDAEAVELCVFLVRLRRSRSRPVMDGFD